MLVREGQNIRKGELLAKLEDSAERVQLAQLKAKAEDMTVIKARKAGLDQAKLDLKKIKEAYKTNAATEMELERAQLQVTISEAEWEIAKFQNRMDILSYDEAKLQLDRMQLKSPIDGSVETILVDEGESVDTQMKPVMRLISIDPMWVEAEVPVARAKLLKTGQVAKVTFGLGDSKTAKGKIIHIASDADSGSETIFVRVEVPNPAKRHTGENVRVTFPEKTVTRDTKTPSKNKNTPKRPNGRNKENQ